MGEKWVKHYSSKHDILLVGEGDFSFAASLASAFGSAHNIVATSLDSEEMLKSMYPSAAGNLALLKAMGCTLVHGVDAKTMAHHPCLDYRKFDRIVFNFPHAGFPAKEACSYQIELHQEVVREFMRSAYKMVRGRGGEVHVTHKTEWPYCVWNVEEIGVELGFVLIDKAAFDITDYPSYQNKRGSGSFTNDTFRLGHCATFKFSLLSNIN